MFGSRLQPRRKRRWLATAVTPNQAEQSCRCTGAPTKYLLVSGTTLPSFSHFLHDTALPIRYRIRNDLYRSLDGTTFGANHEWITNLSAASPVCLPSDIARRE